MNNDGFQMYQNSGYTNTRNNKRTLILDVDDSDVVDTHLGSATEFNIELFEPLTIDKHSEIYLDNFITFNSNISQIPSTSAFSLKINEFNINSNVASSSSNQHIFNSLIIPNDHTTVSNNHTAILHKSKKFNYVCDINPQKIHSISGKITDLAGGPIFHGADDSSVFTYTITGIESGNLDISVINGKSFTAISNVTVPSGTPVNGEFIASHDKSATELHFSTDKEITVISNFSTNIEFTISGGNLLLTNGADDNPSLTLVQNPGRFIAEFSIISV